MTHKKIVEITNNFSSSTILTNNFTYIINGEIHVLEGVTLNIEYNTLIMIRNGKSKNSKINYSSLIFDSGSNLYSSEFYVSACDSNNIPEPLADNGGLWFLGSLPVTKDGISSYKSTLPSSFNVYKIYTYYLGSKDPLLKNNHSNEPSTDQDAVTFLGCEPSECKILGIYIENSGDNAIDIVESDVTINNIEVINPGEDAINIQSGSLEVKSNLKLHVPLTSVYDRDIFDFETDKGPSTMKILQNCFVDIIGIFGDQLTLISNDLPQPEGDNIYYYKGVTSRGDSYIFTNNIYQF